MKSCPDCAEEVQDAARVCKHCGYRFDPKADISQRAEGTVGSLRRAGRGLAEGVRQVAKEVSAGRERTRKRTIELERLAGEQGQSERRSDEWRSIARQLLDDEQPVHVFTAKPNWRRRRCIAVTDRRIVTSDPKGESNLRLEDLQAVSAESKWGRGRLQCRTKDDHTEVFAAIEPEAAAGSVGNHLQDELDLPEIEKKDKKLPRPPLLGTVGLGVIAVIVISAVAGSSSDEAQDDRSRSRPAQEPSAQDERGAGSSSTDGGGSSPARQYAGEVENDIITENPEAQSASCRPDGIDILSCRIVVGPTPANPYGSSSEYVKVQVSPGGSWQPLGPGP